jgi:hypothetical protein
MRDSLDADIESYEAGEVPSPLVLNTVPRFEEWLARVGKVGELFTLRIVGDVYGRPDVQDGARILSPPIAWMDRKGRFIRCLNNLYVLGSPAGEEIPIDGVDI